MRDLCWATGGGINLDRLPDVPILRLAYQICASRGPDNMRCDRPQGHGGRCYESIWDGTDDTEFRCVIGVWWAE